MVQHAGVLQSLAAVAPHGEGSYAVLNIVQEGNEYHAVIEAYPLDFDGAIRQQLADNEMNPTGEPHSIKFPVQAGNYLGAFEQARKMLENVAAFQLADLAYDCEAERDEIIVELGSGSTVEVYSSFTHDLDSATLRAYLDAFAQAGFSASDGGEGRLKVMLPKGGDLLTDCQKVVNTYLAAKYSA